MAGNISVFRRMQMKSIKKLIFVLAALTAVFGFVACSDDDDDGGSSAVVFVATVDGASATVTFDGGDFKAVLNVPGNSYELASGTYTGDPSKDGDITLKYAKMSGMTITRTETVTIKNGKVTVNGTEYTRK